MLRERVEQLVDEQRLKLVTVGVHKLVTTERALAGAYNAVGSPRP